MPIQLPAASAALAGTVLPLFDQLKGIVPMPGSQWPYTLLGVVLTGLLSANTDLELARAVLGRRLHRYLLRRWGALLIFLGIVGAVGYRILDLITVNNAATWVYVAFPALYIVVLGCLTLGIAWLRRGADPRIPE